jgi:hypothetical protein
MVQSMFVFLSEGLHAFSAAPRGSDRANMRLPLRDNNGGNYTNTHVVLHSNLCRMGAANRLPNSHMNPGPSISFVTSFRIPWGSIQVSFPRIRDGKDSSIQPDGTDCTATVSDMLECEAKAHEAFSKGKRKSASVLPDDFMFENEDGGFLDTDNYRKRVLHKVARELQLPKLTFQVIRRTIATLAQKKGTVKDVQGVMQHSRTATTTDVYMQEIPASVQSTINSINSELRKSEIRSRKTPKKSGTTGRWSCSLAALVCGVLK